MSRRISGAKPCLRIGLGVVLALALLAPPALLRAQDGELAVGAPAPVVSVPDLDGKPVNLGDFIGKRPVFLEYWATWCSVCTELLPRVRAAEKKYGKDVEFIGINVAVNQSVSRVKRYAETEKPPFRILYDKQGVSTRSYGATTTSYIVIIDRAGKIAYIGVGADQPFEAALAKVAKP